MDVQQIIVTVTLQEITLGMWKLRRSSLFTFLISTGQRLGKVQLQWKYCLKTKLDQYVYQEEMSEVGIGGGGGQRGINTRSSVTQICFSKNTL